MRGGSHTDSHHYNSGVGTDTKKLSQQTTPGVGRNKTATNSHHYNSGVGVPEIIPTDNHKVGVEIIPTEIISNRQLTRLNHYNSGVGYEIIPTDNHKVGVPRNYPNRQPWWQIITLISESEDSSYNSGAGVPRNYPNRQPRVRISHRLTHHYNSGVGVPEIIPTDSHKSRSTKKLSQQTTSSKLIITLITNHESEDLTQTHHHYNSGVGVPRNYPNRQPQEYQEIIPTDNHSELNHSEDLTDSHHYNSGEEIRNHPNRQPQVNSDH
ncbi:unnamed protein product [Mytilus edulis]|uniref:Uncharacterized protein n=1 Tax=Mytilus edulis TaxID=6550 RepID=A0A8S3TC26_MYTED|nr:unnamed protein product [Mytilus edulis]